MAQELYQSVLPQSIQKDLHARRPQGRFGEPFSSGRLENAVGCRAWTLAGRPGEYLSEAVLNITPAAFPLPGDSQEAGQAGEFRLKRFSVLRDNFILHNKYSCQCVNLKLLCSHADYKRHNTSSSHGRTKGPRSSRNG